MTVSLKLTIGFLIIALLVGAVGWLGFHGTRHATSLHAELGGDFVPFTKAATGITSYSKRAEGHLNLYLLYGDQVDRDKFYSKHEALNAEIDAIEPLVTRDPQLIKKLKALSEEILATGETLLEEYDRAPTSFNYKEHEELIRKFHTATSGARKAGVELARVERELFLIQESLNLNTEVASYSKRAESHLILYLMFGAQVDREKFYSRHDLLDYVITRLRTISANPNESELVDQLEALSTDILRNGEALLAEYDKAPPSFELKDHEELVKEFYSATSGARKLGIKLSGVNSEEISTQVRSVDRAVKRAQRTILIVIALAVLAAVVIGVLVSRQVTRPLKTLTKAAQNIGQGNLQDPVPTLGTRETLVLGQTLEHMRVELLTLYRNLERQVGERTQQLSKSNEDLVAEISQRKEAEQELQNRAVALEAANHELEAFSYSVSHDLRAPLRSINGFSQVLLEDCAEQLDESAKDYLHRILLSSQRMGQLIGDLLQLSRISRDEIIREAVDLSDMAHVIKRELLEGEPERQVEFVIAPALTAHGDTHLLNVVLENLFRNAWKFTGPHQQALIEFGTEQHHGESAFFVRDDGVGFDMTYADKLFGAFQRLHYQAEFDGTGIGLATVQRIIRKHGGRVWAEGAVEKGASIYFTV